MTEITESNSGKDFELFTQSVYQLLLSEEGLTNCTVQHNVELKGKSDCLHQIDVYWKFSIAGIEHQVAIECKDYSRNVAIGRIRDFYGALNDIGNVKGIFVTKIGYQSGALKFGDYYGIDLKLLNPPALEDFEDKISSITIQGTLIGKTNEVITPIFDGDWIKNQHPEYLNAQIEISGLNSEIFVYNELGDKIISFLDMCQNLPANSGEGRFDYVHKFNDGYLKDGRGGMIKIIGVKFEYDVYHCRMSPIEFDAMKFVKGVIHDVKSGEKLFVRVNSHNEST